MNAQKPDALRLADALAYCDSSVASQAACAQAKEGDQHG